LSITDLDLIEKSPLAFESKSFVFVLLVSLHEFHRAQFAGSLRAGFQEQRLWRRLVLEDV